MSQAPAPKFDPAAPHMTKPRLRPVRGFMTQGPNGQMMLGLADARQISDRMVFTSPAAQHLLPMLDGSKGLDEIVSGVGRGLTRSILEDLVAQLDAAGLLVGPTYDGLVARMRTAFDDSAVLPPASTAAFMDLLVRPASPEGETDPNAPAPEPEQVSPEELAARFRGTLDQWMAEALKDAENPSLDALPAAIVAPHLDYPRGWMNYASAWGRLRVADRPDRVIILGTNHFGEATGVCGCDKGYQTALGTCEADAEFIGALRRTLGPDHAERLFRNRYDHEHEHSIELQIPWIQHCLGADDRGRFPRVFGALVHDPSVNNGESYDGAGLALDPFVDAVRATLESAPGKTLLVASADLSHMGPAFGDQVSPAQQDEAGESMRESILRHDQEMVGLIAQNKPDELVAAMAWQQNPTRWCSVGNLVATLKIVKPGRVELFKYVAAMDQTGQALVSSVSMALHP